MRAVGGEARYRQLLAEPGLVGALITSQAARLPASMVSLAIILHIAGPTGTYAKAGLATGAYIVGVALAGPVLGRLTDRLGYRTVLLTTSVVDAGLLIALALVPVRHTALLLLTAGAAGLFFPPVAASMRALWPKLAQGSARDLLFSLDATLQETTWIVGPALVAVLATVAGPTVPLMASGLVGLAGTLALVRRPLVPNAPSPGGYGTSGLWSSGLVTLMLVSMLFAAGTGGVQVAVVAFAHLQHAGGQSGALIAVWSLGSLVGGLLFGRRAAARGAGGLGLLLLYVGAGEILLAGSTTLGLLYLVLFVGGMGFAPVIGCLLRVVGDVAPWSSATEAFGWIYSSNRVGAAVGAAVGGLLIEARGTWPVFIAAGVTTVLAGVAAFSGRSALVTQHA